MVYRYNLNNLEALFKEYLISGIKKNQPLHKNTVKNYLSDIRHFLGWFSQSVKESDAFFSLSRSHIEAYKKYLIANNLPARTVNRRLSTVRKFCFFCTEAKILHINPSKGIGNICTEKIRKIKDTTISSLINDFRHELISEGLSANSIKICIRDIENFFSEVAHYG
ncbi:MAG TPA: site-specific integrase [Patescibacteria group bacterium]|nr:site-specific integrase [Patescibacteria group bacterium]